MLILASASPRRRELLTQIGVAHTVQPADIDETRHPDEEAQAYVRRLALEKAAAVATHHSGATVLAADTTVVLNGEILNKPADLADAGRMLGLLSGRTHQVHTGVAVTCAGNTVSHVETTAVTFTSISSADLHSYLETRDSLDKAGAYGIQGYAARWIARIDGDFFNVVGLPLVATLGLLEQVKGA